MDQPQSAAQAHTVHVRVQVIDVEARTLDLFPFETWNAGIPAGYKCLATGPEGAVLELPYNFTQAHLYYQIEHGRPIFGGMLENNKVFTPRETTELLKNNTCLLYTSPSPRDS